VEEFCLVSSIWWR